MDGILEILGYIAVGIFVIFNRLYRRKKTNESDYGLTEDGKLKLPFIDELIEPETESAPEQNELIANEIEGIDEATASELISRATESLEKEKIEISKKLIDLGVEDSLINLKGMTQGMLVVLGEKNIKKLKDFADLSSDELIGGFDEIKGKRIRINGYLEDFGLSREEADNLIMGARKIVFAD